MSGIRPTGFLHLGNYFGAMRNYVKMQDLYPCFFMVADLHSLTTHPDTTDLQVHVQRVLAENIAAGLDPAKVSLYCQSDLVQTGELYLYLNMMAYKGELEKTVTFKEKVRLHPQNINAGLLTYPVLMAADILIHRAHFVPVGKDQEQHLEMARTFANRFNHRYGPVFPEPEAYNFNEQLVKIPSLNGEGKMSKSAHESATLYLADEDDVIRKKVMKAKTDSGPSVADTPKPEYIANLFQLMSLVSQPDTLAFYEEKYKDCAIRYGDMKKQLAEDMIAFITPMRKKAKDIFSDKDYLKKTMRMGAEKAVAHAEKTMQEVRKAMGLLY